MNCNNALISSEYNRIWPVSICIEKSDFDDTYLIITLCTNGIIHVKSVIRSQEFPPNVDMSKSNLIFSSKIDENLDAQFELNEILLFSNRSYLKYSYESLVAYLVTDNNSSNETKMFIKKWRLKSTGNDCHFEEIDIYNTNYTFLNEKNLEAFNVKRYDIIAFGLRLVIFS